MRRQASPKRILGAQMSLDECERIDARMALLGRGIGALRVQVGDGLRRLEEVGGWQALGFPTLESYTREALGRSGRWAADARWLSRKLESLPLLRRAIFEGRVQTSMVELVARVATPEDEATWLVDAEMMTVRQMRARLKAQAGDDGVRPRVTVQATVDRIDAWAFERARLMVETVGAGRGDAAIEAMLAEGLTEMLAIEPDLDLPSGIGTIAIEGTRTSDGTIAIDRTETSDGLVGAALVAAHTCRPPPSSGPRLSDIEWPTELRGINQALRELARTLAWRDLELADLGRRCFEHIAWEGLGFESFDHYCRERIGVSPSGMASRVALARRMIALPEIETAVGNGSIGYEAAALVARIAGAETVEAWIDRAANRTMKQLRDEVAAVEMVARAEGARIDRLGPPDRETMEVVQDLEATVVAAVTGQMSGGHLREGQMSGEDESAEIAVPTRTIRLSLSEDTGRFWRTMEMLHAGMAIEGSFVAFLARAVSKTWSGSLPRDVAYAHVYRRDRWRCASPVCTSRNITPHHVVFRSRGGGDEMSNVVSLCERCHLELVHGGRLTVSGDANVGLKWAAAGWEVPVCGR